MTLRIAAFIACLGFSGVALAADAFVVAPDQPIAATVNGSPVRLQLFGTGGRVMLNPDVAQRLGIKPSMLSAQGHIGPVKVPGDSAVTSYEIGGMKAKQRIVWFGRPIAPGFDGAVGPASIPAPVVTFRLQAAQPGERRFVLPLAQESDLGRMGSVVTIGGVDIRVLWDFTRATTLVTAAAGEVIARTNGGVLQGAGWQEPIRMGITRPARRMVLATPLILGPLSFADIVTRVSDNGNGSAIPDAEVDQEEIVVTAKNSRVKPAYFLQIGRDAMRRCSSLTFDKPHKQVILNCL